MLESGKRLRMQGDARIMAEILEAIMMVCFGLSWPLNAYKAFKSRTAAGTSWQFIALITAGYIAGIAAKFVSGNINWVLAVYVANVVAVAVCFCVYMRNRKLDAARTLVHSGASVPVVSEESFSEAR